MAIASNNRQIFTNPFYRFKVNEDLVEVILVRKRNDDEVYKILSRLLG